MAETRASDPAPRTLLPLTLRGVTYAASGRTLIRALDLRIAHPGITAIMGPNGAGKSLLLRLVHGLLIPGSGDIRWNDAPLSEAVRRRQALVFQRPVLLRRSVVANIEFVLALRAGSGPDARELLEHVGLGDRADQPARRLSGGEQQRLAMARALALAPEVLLLDEPTASLDPAASAAIEALVLEARDDGKAVLYVTHDIGQARRLADEVVFLHRGQLAEQTPADAFFDSPRSRPARDYLAGRLVL